MARQKKTTNGNGATVGFEAQLWAAADKLRGVMDAAEYKHVALGLIFLKYISDSFAERYSELERETADPKSDWFARDKGQRTETLEDRDSYTMAHVYFVPPEARWSYLQSRAKDPKIGLLIDNAMTALERDNPKLKGVLPKNYAREQIDKATLGGLIDLFANVNFRPSPPTPLPAGEGRRNEVAQTPFPSPDGRGSKGEGAQPESAYGSKDLLGRAYEYFLTQFASAEGKKGGQFYTPRCIVRLLVAMLEPFKGRVFDPCCGSGGMFVQSERFVQEHGGNVGDISVFGQERNQTTYRLCVMNLAIRGIEGSILWNNEGSFHNDLHKDLRADFVLANPPFNDSDWGGDRLKDDKRWKYGVPPEGNANFAWVQHFIHHLAPTGSAGFVLANGSMSSNQSGEGEIRKNIIEADLVDCMIALPGQLFYSTQIPVCLWFVTRSKSGMRDRRGETLFIDAKKLGTMVDRTHRELTDDDIRRIADTYHAWRGNPANPHPNPLPVGEGDRRSGEGRPALGEGHYRGGYDFAGLAERARELRKKQTPAEEVMWELLRDRRFLGLKFRRQHQFGDYVADFYCDEHKLVVELDGPIHDKQEQKQHDTRRDSYLRSQGLTVVRLPNSEVLGDTESGLKKIAAALPFPLSGRGNMGEGSPSPAGRGRGEGDVYRDVLGLCKSAKLDEIRGHGHILTPGRYVGAEPQAADSEPFAEKMQRLTADLEKQLEESDKLEKEIRKNLKGLGYGA